MDEKTYNLLFGARVKYYREKIHLTQKNLADKLGYTSHSTIAQIEAGRQTIPLSRLQDFCIALDCGPLDLLGLNEKDKQLWILAENMQNSNKNADFSKFLDLYMKLLSGGSNG